MSPHKHTYYYVVLLLCCFIVRKTATAQGTCSSSALAPVFSQTFGQGSSSGSKTTVPSGFVTNYTFQGTGSLNDGNYIVTPRVQNSGRNDWAVGGDHTGDNNGNMFLVNAGTGGSVFFYQQVDNLCPGSTYNFSAWLANVNTNSNTLPICGGGYIYPNVTFNIKNTSGTILATYSTGNIPLTANRGVDPNWQQYGFSFALPSGTTSLVLEMVDAYGGQPQCGNDLAIDDILFTACTPTATVSFSTASTICSGSNTSINASIMNSPFTSPAYQWQKSTDGGSSWTHIGSPGTLMTTFNLNNVSGADQALYRVLVGPDVASLSSSTCITASSPISLTVAASPVASVNAPVTVCSGNTINLSSTVSNGESPYSYSWTGPNGFEAIVANPSITNAITTHAGTYSLVVTGNNGCSATASTGVTVNTTPSVNAIAGPKGGCVGSNITLTNTTPGGVWSSSNTTIATVDQHGQVTLLSGGDVTISYTVTANGCSATATKNITAASVQLGADLIECNNGVRSYTDLVTNPYYAAYSHTGAGTSYLWSFVNHTTGLVETDIYKSGKTNASDFPSIQLQSGHVYAAAVQFTVNDITCSATQNLYKQINLTGSIASSQDTTVCFNAADIPLLGQVSVVANAMNWYTINGSGSFSSTNSLNTTYTPSAADKANGVVYIVFAASTSLNATGNCGSSNVSDTMALRILTENTGTNTTATICSGALFQHAGSSGIPGSSFSWVSTVISGSGSGNTASGSGTINNTLINASGNVDFVVEYTITPSFNGCTGTAYTVRVTVAPLPVITVTNNAANICTAAPTAISFGSSLSNTQYTWSSAVVTGTISGNSQNNIATTGNTIEESLMNNSNANATVRYQVTGISADGCSSSSQTDVIVYPIVTVANAGTDQTICNLSTAILDGNQPSSGNGIWSFVSGPGAVTFNLVNQYNTAVNGLVPGSYQLKWTISNSVCPSSEDIVEITVVPPTNPGTLSSDATVCATGNTGTIQLIGQFGSIIQTEYSINNGIDWNILSGSSGTASISFSQLSTTTQYRTLVKNNVCDASYSNTVTITVLNNVTTADAGIDQILCAVNAATLAGNQPVSGTGTWSQIAGPSTALFTNAATYNTSITGLVPGSYQFRWTISNGVCADSFDDVVIQIDDATVAGSITGSTTVCVDNHSGTLTLTGYTGSIIQWAYSIDNGTHWVPLVNTIAQHHFSNLSATTIFRAEVKSGVCNAAFSTPATVQVDAIAVPGILSGDATVCNGNNSGTLSLSGNNGTIVHWEYSTDNGNQWNIIANSTGTYSYNNLTAATLFRVLVQNGVCSNAYSNQVSIQLDPVTIPGTLAGDASVCFGNNSGNIQLAGNNGMIEYWQFSTDGGTNWTTVTQQTNTFSYTNLTLTTIYRASVKSGVCASAFSNTVTISVIPVSVGGTISGTATVCSGNNTGTLTLTGYTGSIMEWQQSIDGGLHWTSIPHTGSSYSYNDVSVTSQYRAIVQNGVCAPVFSDIVVISVDAITIAGTAGGDNTACSGNNSGDIILTGNNGNILHWEASVDNGLNWDIVNNSTSTLHYNNLATTTWFRALVQNGVCSAAYSNVVTITIVPQIVNSINSQVYTVCEGQSVTILAIPATGGTGTYQYQWQQSANGSSWSDIPGATGVQYSFIPTDAQVLIRRVVNSLPCSVISNQVVVNMQPALSNNSIPASIEVCTGNNTVIHGSIPAGGDGFYFYQWQQSTDLGSTWTDITDATEKDYTTIALTSTTWYRRIVTTLLCQGIQSSTSNETIITVRPHATAVIQVATNIACTPFEIKENNVQAIPNAATNSSYEWFADHVSIGPGIQFPGYILPVGKDQVVIRLKANSLYNCNTAFAEAIISGSHAAQPAFTVSDTLGCGPMTVNVTNTTPAINNYQYHWYLDQALISFSQQLNQITLQHSVSGLDTSYTLTLHASSTLCGSYHLSKTIIVRAKPKASFTALPDTGCSPASIVFQNETVGSHTLYQYRFADGTDTLLNNTATVTHVYNSNLLTTIRPVLFASNECGIDSIDKPIIIKPDNIQPILFLSDSSLCGPGIIRFSNQTQGGLRFHWDFGDGHTFSTTSTGDIAHTYQQPGSYTFRLTIDNDCSIQIIQHTIRIHPAPVALFSLNQPDFCVGDSVRFNNQSSYANSYRWLFSNGDSSTNTSPVLAYSNAGNIQASLIAGTIYAPDQKACFDTVHNNMIIVSSRQGSMTVSSKNGACLPHEVHVSSLNIPAAGIVWSWGDSTTGTGDKAVHNYLSNGIYTLHMVATSAAGCQYKDSAIITINSPSGTLNVSAKTICLGEQATFNVVLRDDQPVGSDSIIWYPGDGNKVTSTSTTFTYSYQQPGIYYPKAFLLKAGGCLIPLPATDSVKVDKVSARFGLSAVFECGNTSFRFHDSSNAYFGLRSWKWVLNGKDSSFEKNKIALFTTAGNQNIELIIESNTGCTANYEANFDVNVYQYPIANINAMAEACKTDLLQLKSNVSSQDSVVLRFWNLSNGIIARDSVISATFSSEGKYSVKLTVATVNQCYDSVYKELTIHPIPSIAVEQNKIVCRGDSVTIRANGAARYIWKDQYENMICNNCEEITVKPGNNISYKVIGYNQYGCSEIQSANVRVINPLKMHVSTDDTLCIGDSKTLFATGAASYSWFPATGLSSTATATTVAKPVATTTYKVIGKDAFNCFTDTATIKVVVGAPTPISLGKDTTIVSGNSYQLRVIAPGNDLVKWRWSGAPGISCVTCPEPLLKLSDDVCISCTVINRYGCVSTDTVCIKTFCPTTEVFVPNAFTPDGDGINDKLIIQGKGIKMIKSFRIFNRWGEVVFEKVNFSPGDPAYAWDGKIRGHQATPDVYVYVCEVICEKGLPSIFKGNTAIIK